MSKLADCSGGFQKDSSRGISVFGSRMFHHRQRQRERHMPAYRLYLTRNGVREPFEIIAAATDLEAIDVARTRTEDSDFELWQGLRMVVAIDRPEGKAA